MQNDDYILLLSIIFCVALMIYACWKPERRQDKDDKDDSVCDGCGQVTSELREGLCAWCTNFYNTHK
jgi:hypothetical protein